MTLRKKAFVVIASAAALVMGFATTASAGTDAVSQRGDTYAKFISYGDKFKVCDKATDGFDAYVEYKYVKVNGVTQHEEHHVGTGSGTCATFDHNFGEGRSVTFRACVAVPGFIDPCDGWKVGIA
jgi:hypothetical protein